MTEECESAVETIRKTNIYQIKIRKNILKCKETNEEYM